MFKYAVNIIVIVCCILLLLYSRNHIYITYERLNTLFTCICNSLYLVCLHIFHLHIHVLQCFNLLFTLKKKERNEMNSFAVWIRKKFITRIIFFPIKISFFKSTVLANYVCMRITCTFKFNFGMLLTISFKLIEIFDCIKLLLIHVFWLNTSIMNCVSNFILRNYILIYNKGNIH